MLNQLKSEYAALDKRVAALEYPMNLTQLKTDYAALDVRVSALEKGPDSQFYTGAEGYAAKVLGGRVEGGRDVVVTDYTDPELSARNAWVPGTLRWAMHQPSPKRIIFPNPGTIRLRMPIQVVDISQSSDMTFNETRVPMTILGCIRMDAIGNSVWLNTRFRAALWNNGWKLSRQFPYQSTGDSLHLNSTMNTLIMNCEFSGGADELFNIKYQRGDCTIQDSVFCESFQSGNFGMIWGDDLGHNYGAILTTYAEGQTGISLIRNYWANLMKRMPTEEYTLPVNPRPRRMVVVNNVFYNWGRPCGSFEGVEHSVIAGCTFKTGPSTNIASIVGQCTSAYIVDSILNRAGSVASLHIQPPVGHPTGLRNLFTNGEATTIAGTELPADLAKEINCRVLPREEALRHVLAEAGVTPIDNCSKANRQSFVDNNGWQGANPAYVNGSLDAYLEWATGIQKITGTTG